MNELQIYNSTVLSETERTPIEVLLQVGEDGRVSARDVYEFLGLRPSGFSEWSKANITDNQFAESDADFTIVTVQAEVRNNFAGTIMRPMTDYRLSVPFAKKLCMLSRSERGEQAREYFIAVEKTLQTVAQHLPQLTPAQQMLQLSQIAVDLEVEQAAIKQRQTALESRIETAEQIVLETGALVESKLQSFANPGVNWHDAVKMAVMQLVDGMDGWALKRLLGRMYSDLEVAATCDLSQRVAFKQKRLKNQGATYKQRIGVTKLDVIADDKQLRKFFEEIIRKYQALYCREGRNDQLG